MAKAKFGIGDILDIKRQKPGQEGESGYQEIWLNPREVKPSESNFYSQENIEELADSFLTVGQQQPTVLGRIDGEYRIVSGHRRNLANIKNLERGHKEYERVRYLCRDMTPAMLELSLLMGNAYNRELTPWEKTQQAQRLKEALLRAKKEDGLEITGKLRDVVADLMHESSSGIARMDSIHNNAIPEIKEEFKKGNLSICAAYEAAKLPEEEQREIAERASEEGSVQVKEIAGRTSKKKAVDSPFPVVSKMDTRLQSKAEHKGESAGITGEEKKQQVEKDGKSKPFKRADRHTEILRVWRTEKIDQASIIKSVTDALQKVSKMDTAKTGWTDTEWAVFLTGAIMNYADYVSEEDLYLLHDIMIRCQEAQENI